jgi:hypothetical protein
MPTSTSVEPVGPATPRRIAVVLPVHNHERYVAEAIASVLGQTRPPDRLVVVDDGSSDDSVAVAERALADAGPITAEFRTQRNRGSARTLNEAIAGLDEEIVALLNSDDVWAPDRLERLMPELDDDGPGLVFSGVEFFGDEREEDLATYPLWMAQSFSFGACLPTVGFNLLINNIAVSTGNLLFTRDVHELVGGFDERMPVCHDWQFLISTLRIAEPVLVPDPLYRYRIHGTNTYRQHSEPSGREMLKLHQSMMSWATATTANPLAPTPRNFPRLMPFFVTTWLRTAPPGCHMVPKHFMQLATRHRGQADAVPREIEHEAIAAQFARIRRDAPKDLASAPSLGEARRTAAERWRSVRRRLRGGRRSVPDLRGHAARFEWAGAATTVAAHDPTVLADLADFTGLEAIPTPLAIGRAETNVLHEREVYVHEQYRLYPRAENRLIWVALTVGEFLARHAGCPLLHAASIEFDGRVALVCGPPFAGKSTLTLRAIARGLRVLGDDQVRVEEGGSRVQALPRPVKLRVDLDAPLPDGVSAASRPLRGMLDDEQTLMLRRDGAASPDRWMPVAGIFHLSRRDDDRCALEPIDEADHRHRLQSQLRGPHAEVPDALDGVYAGLLRVPRFSLAVGLHGSDAALDLITETCVSAMRDRSANSLSGPRPRP